MKKILAIIMTTVLSSCFSFQYFENVETLYESNHFCHNQDCENIIFPELLTENSNVATRSLGPVGPITPGVPSANVLPSHYVPNKVFTHNYFKNLRSNTFNNVPYYVEGGISYPVAKCPFVAIGMYFSYLDVYWNDSIIDNTYQTNVILNEYNDVNVLFESPGINDNHDLSYVVLDGYPHPTESELDSLIRNYITSAAEYKNSSYLAYLVNLANEINLFPTGYLSSLGLNLSQIISLINAVIDDSTILNGNATVHYYTSNSYDTYDEFESILINKLIEGDPVMVGVPGHVFIAYDYVDGQIMGNRGYKGSHTYDSLDVYGPNPVTDFYFLELSDAIQHKHNSLYINGSSMLPYNRNYCSCELQSHSHSYVYEVSNDTYHKRQCFCEFVVSYKEHVYTHTEHIDLSEYAICGYCNYAKLIDETFEPIV